MSEGSIIEVNETNNKTGSHAYVYLNDACNQKCIFCSRPPEGKLFSLESVKAKIDEYADDSDIAKIVLTGGEPTIHPNFKEIVGYAVSKNKQIDIQTNGSVLDRKDYEDLRDIGLKSVSYAYTSHIPAISNALRGVAGGFEKIESGLIAADALGMEIHLVHVVNKMNFIYLPEFIEHIEYLGIDKRKLWLNIMMVCPSGAAWDNREAIIPRLKDIKPYLIEACHKCNKLGIAFDISEVVPLCVVSGFEKHVSATRFKAHNIRIVDENYSVYGIDNSTIDFNKNNPNLSIKAPGCSSCSLTALCTGFYPQIAELYGTDDFTPQTNDPGPILRDIETSN